MNAKVWCLLGIVVAVGIGLIANRLSGSDHSPILACTGSMDPTITCLDTIQWNYNPTPNDIVVGSVITFVEPDSCLTADERKGDWILHRVIDIRQGMYKTKGDNNPVDDDCWIPFSNVQDMVINVTKGDYPELQAMLTRIWELEAYERRLVVWLDETSPSIDNEQYLLDKWTATYKRNPTQYMYDMITSQTKISNSRVEEYNNAIHVLNATQKIIQGRRVELEREHCKTIYPTIPLDECIQIK
jgi:signal peptidase I